MQIRRKNDHNWKSRRLKGKSFGMNGKRTCLNACFWSIQIVVLYCFFLQLHHLWLWGICLHFVHLINCIVLLLLLFLLRISNLLEAIIAQWFAKMFLHWKWINRILQLRAMITPTLLIVAARKYLLDEGVAKSMLESGNCV